MATWEHPLPGKVILVPPARSEANPCCPSCFKGLAQVGLLPAEALQGIPIVAVGLATALSPGREGFPRR
ncbi:MAG: hypothetical protein M0017_11860 [Desulfobacteraceae bacterium]|nr:hypothetical protein [Desulfobacteraceae bacterium]